MKKALITGVTGQDGSYLAELLIQKGYQVHGVRRRSSSFNTSRIDHLYKTPESSESSLILHHGDMTDSISLMSIISKVQPTEIYNLASQSHVHVSFEEPEYTANTAGMGTLRILEAIRILGLVEKTRFYQASTSEMFGGESSKSLNELSEFNPVSPYAIAKLYAHKITQNYRNAYGIFASSGILFNHESPRRGETFVTRKITRALTRIAYGIQDCLYLGNLDSLRDWGHAKDYVEAQWMILQHNEPDDFVISSGVQKSVRNFVEDSAALLGIELEWSGSGISEVGTDQFGKTIIRIDKRYYRPMEVPRLLGDSSKATKILKWTPKISYPELVAEMTYSDEREVESITSKKNSYKKPV